jgi:Flp pilus assembly protein TadD
MYTSTVLPADAERARVGAQRAVELAPGRPEGYRARGAYYEWVRDDFARAAEEYRQALQIAPQDPVTITTVAALERRLGDWAAALAHFQQAATLDPRSPDVVGELAVTLLQLRRYSEALAASDRALALAPANLDVITHRAMISLGEGDLAGARAVLHGAPDSVSPTALVAYVAIAGAGLFWVLDDAQQQLLLRLTPGAFGDNRWMWGLSLAQTYWLRGEKAKAQTYADSARIALMALLPRIPKDSGVHVFLALALAYLGRKAEAVREGERGVALQPIAKDAWNGPASEQYLARVYVLLGEQDKAVGHLEPLLKIPYHLSRAWLRIDATFAPLRGNARFEQLVRGP